MSSTKTATDELSQILKEYCHPGGNISDIKVVENPLTQVSEAQRYELLSSISDEFGYNMLSVAAHRVDSIILKTIFCEIRKLPD